MKRGDRERLDDISEAIASIRAHAAHTKANERLRRDAILYNLLILGEGVKALSDDLTADQPQIPWRQIAGLRDLLAHQYYRIDMSVIEGIIKRDLDPLDAAIRRLRGARARARSTARGRIANP